MKEKTINFLNTKANETESLLGQAAAIREKMNVAKTSLAQEYYKKKLLKVVDKLDANIRFFSMLEKDIIKSEESTETKDVE